MLVCLNLAKMSNNCESEPNALAYYAVRQVLLGKSFTQFGSGTPKNFKIDLTFEIIFAAKTDPARKKLVLNFKQNQQTSDLTLLI